MPETRQNMRDALRNRLGELSAGTWTDAELNDYIKKAERKVCENCIVEGAKQKEGLLTSIYERYIVSERYKYILPADFLSVILLQHLHDGTLYEVRQANIADLLSYFQPETTSSIISNYEVHGKTARVLGYGVATGGSNTTLEDTVVALDGMGARANVDIVQNITDDSEAVITEITSGDVLTFSAGLSGGARNSFRLGDEWQVIEGEETCDILWVYPPPSESDVDEVVAYDSGADGSVIIGDSGGTEYQAAQSFQVDEPVVIKEVEILLDDNVGSPIGALVIRIETDNTGVPSGTLANTSAVASIAEPDDGVWNKAIFNNFFRLSKDTTYHLVVLADSQDTDNYFTWQVDTTSPSYSDGLVSTKAGAGAWANDSTKDAMFRLYGTTKEDSLVLHYARYPRPMTNDADKSEMPYFAEEAVYLWAEYLAYLKRYGRRSAEARETLLLFQAETQKITRLLLRRSRDSFKVVREVLFSSTRIPGQKNVSIQDKLPLGQGS